MVTAQQNHHPEGPGYGDSEHAFPCLTTIMDLPGRHHVTLHRQKDVSTGTGRTGLRSPCLQTTTWTHGDGASLPLEDAARTRGDELASRFEYGSKNPASMDEGGAASRYTGTKLPQRQRTQTGRVGTGWPQVRKTGHQRTRALPPPPLSIRMGTRLPRLQKMRQISPYLRTMAYPPPPLPGCAGTGRPQGRTTERRMTCQRMRMAVSSLE